MKLDASTAQAKISDTIGMKKLKETLLRSKGLKH
jgi:hypothetical protein